MAKARIRRPTLERTAPIRTWEGAFARPTSEPDGERPAEPAGRLQDVVARSVELGYRVIDDYMRRGQEAARRMRHGTYGPGALASDVESVTGQLTRSAADLAGAWAEFFALAGRDGAASAEPAAPLADAIPPTAPASTERLRVRLRAAAKRPVESMLELPALPADATLVVHALRAMPPATGRIDGVRVERSDAGTVVIHVGIPADQPPGRYRAAVIDETTNVAVGELNVVVLDA
jgi:hypothetical protein